MENPFKKVFGGSGATTEVSSADSPIEQTEDEVETNFDNHGDYYEFIASKGGKEIKRKRAESNPDDAESLKREYKQFRREVGATEELDLNMQ